MTNETSAADAAASDRTWTVDELARAADTMTTTIRMYQNKGLLHAPAKRGRVAVYDQSHLDRIGLIAELQRRGHSLAGIADLLASYERGEPLTDVLGVESLRSPEPVRLSLLELAERLGGAMLSPADLMRAAEAGIVTIDGEVAVVADRRFLEIGSALVALGVPPSIVLDEWEHLAAAMGDVSARFVAVFEAHLLPGLDDATLGDVVAAVERLAGLARQVTVAALDAALRSDVKRFVDASGG